MEESTFHQKTLTEVKELLLERVSKQLHPMVGTREDDVQRACNLLQNLEPDHWAQVWTKIARPYEEEAQKQANLNNFGEAEQNYLLAHNYYFVGRFSSPDTPSRQMAYRSAVACYQKAANFFHPPMETAALLRIW